MELVSPKFSSILMSLNRMYLMLLRQLRMFLFILSKVYLCIRNSPFGKSTYLQKLCGVLIYLYCLFIWNIFLLQSFLQSCFPDWQPRFLILWYFTKSIQAINNCKNHIIVILFFYQSHGQTTHVGIEIFSDKQ